MDKLIF